MHRPPTANTAVQLHRLRLELTAKAFDSSSRLVGCSQHTAVCMQVHMLAQSPVGIQHRDRPFACSDNLMQQQHIYVSMLHPAESIHCSQQ